MALVGKGTTVEVLDPIVQPSNPPTLQPGSEVIKGGDGQPRVSAPVIDWSGDYSIRFRLLLTPDMSFQGDIASLAYPFKQDLKHEIGRDKGLLDGKEFLAFYEDVFEEPPGAVEVNLIRHEEPSVTGGTKVSIEAKVELIIGFCDSSAERAVTAILLERRVHMMQKRVEVALGGDAVGEVPCLAGMGVLSVNDFEMRSRREVLTKALHTVQKAVRGMLGRRRIVRFQEVVKEAVIEQDRHFRFQFSLATAVMWKKGKAIATQPTPTDTTAVDSASTELRTAGATDDTPTESEPGSQSAAETPVVVAEPPGEEGYPELVSVKQHLAEGLSLPLGLLQESSVVVGRGMVTCTFEVHMLPTQSPHGVKRPSHAISFGLLGACQPRDGRTSREGHYQPQAVHTSRTGL